MMPRDSVYGSWAASGEIDIMEFRGGQNSLTESTLHFGGGWPKNKYEGSGPRNMNADLTADYHVYAAVWTPESIEFQVDGRTFHTMTLRRSFNNEAAGSFPYNQNGQPFDQYFFFIMNVAVGGGFFGGNANALTDAQARAWANPAMYVDYVRVYQLKEGIDVNPTPTPPTTPPVSSAECQAMFKTLECRTSTSDMTSLSADSISGTRNWLCNAFPKYCADINGGKYAGCNAAEQVSNAMNAYYQDYKASQGAGACDFGGLGSTYTTQAPSSTTSKPTTSATPTPTTSSSGSADCTSMWNGLSCRPSESADSGAVSGTRTWLCNNFAKYCTDISSGGKYSTCSATQQVAYAMDKYYQDFKSEQKEGACDFGGLGKVVTPETPECTCSSSCPEGQTMCDDAVFGQQCYVAGSAFDCVTGDDNKKHLCPKDTLACGAACYPPSQYTCVGGWLAKK